MILDKFDLEISLISKQVSFQSKYHYKASIITKQVSLQSKYHFKAIMISGKTVIIVEYSSLNITHPVGTIAYIKMIIT